MKIRYHCAKRTVSVDEPGLTILDISTAHKIQHLRECGGNAVCTTCRVRILDGINHVSPRTDAEARLAESRGWDEFTRLACQTKLTGDVGLERLVQTSAEVNHLQIEDLPEGQGKDRQVAILFCDMRNFTPFVESHLPYDVVHILNRFFSALGERILLCNGFIYQYVGDEITGLFGLGDDAPHNSCLAAVRAGLGMLDALEQLNPELSEEFGEELAVGIGIHFGTVVVGRIGHPSDRRFSVVGDAINVTSRIQGMNKELGTSLLISREVLSQLPSGTVRTSGKGSVSLKGKRDRFKVFEVLGFSESDPVLVLQTTSKQLLGPEAGFAEIFYRRLFFIAPEVRQLFRGELDAQKRMLTQMLESVIYATSRPKNLSLGLMSRGRQHTKYGVVPEHYPIMRQVLLETIEEVLQVRYTKPVAEAWEGTIDSILGLMSRGGR